MMADVVLVIAETDPNGLTPSTLECVEEARDIAHERRVEVHAVLPGSDVMSLADGLAAHGADSVTVVEHPALAQFTSDGWLAALEPLLRTADPLLILAPDSGDSRAWLPRLSVHWRMPLATNCSRVKLIQDGYPEAYRFSHDGRMHERLIWARGTLIGALLAPGVRGIGPPRARHCAKITRATPALDSLHCRDRTLRISPSDPRTVDLTEAERIVSGGLGVGGPDGMVQLQQLAELLGATLGGTRVVADRGWLAADRFIGTTGKIVAPKLYLAFGISGAGQHLAGIGDSDIIVAINTDRTSPLLKMADLGVVGDLHEIVPILLDKLAALTDPAGSADEPSQMTAPVLEAAGS